MHMHLWALMGKCTWARRWPWRQAWPHAQCMPLHTWVPGVHSRGVACRACMVALMGQLSEAFESRTSSMQQMCNKACRVGVHRPGCAHRQTKHLHHVKSGVHRGPAAQTVCGWCARHMCSWPTHLSLLRLGTSTCVQVGMLVQAQLPPLWPSGAFKLHGQCLQSCNLNHEDVFKVDFGAMNLQGSSNEDL